MTEYFDTAWTGTPLAMRTALLALGWWPTPDEGIALGWMPDASAEPPPRHPSVAGMHVRATVDVTGQPAWVALIRATEAITRPAGVHEAPAWVADALVGRIAALGPRVISAKAFFDRFARAERIAMRDNPILDDAERGAGFQGTVNLDSPEAAQLLGYAVTLGILAPTRVAEILA
ncbi:hypothetical protein [Sediminicoccus sp. KRV36]|uniref:hypothetical protein n=1 Tax=Sediminicoccus sp. KRV36 TaxID=3133721 RepID=UPI00200E2EC5|nr:hypothetical protein [Sediminicoccus rosea]UPY35502.1 hypothetical protein LHU95_14885 [Sediminicoccus rosea]